MESTAALGKKFIAQLMICNHCQRKRWKKTANSIALNKYFIEEVLCILCILIFGC